MALPLTLLYFYLVFLPLLAAEETEIQTFCPEYVITKQQHLETPLYPRYYPFVRCWYNLSAPEGFVAVVSFEEFNLPIPESTGVANKQHTSYKDCRTDYVEIYTGIGKGRRFCGEELKNMKIFSESNGKIEFIFQSFTKSNTRGFSASAKFVSTFAFYEANNICDSVLDDSKYHIILNLPKNKECKFVIKAPEGKRPEIQFIHSGGDCVQFTASEQHQPNSVKQSTRGRSTCDQTWYGQQSKFSNRIFGITVERGGSPVKVKIAVRYTDLGDECAKYLEKDRNGYKISFRHDSQEGNKFPSICIWLIEVPQTTKNIAFTYNMDLLEAENGFCSKDQLVFSEVFEDYTRYAETPNPNCGKLNGEVTSLRNSNFPNGPTTVMVMAAFDNGNRRGRKFDVAVRFSK